MDDCCNFLFIQMHELEFKDSMYYFRTLGEKTLKRIR